MSSIINEYKVNENWVEVPIDIEKATICPIIKDSAKLMVFIGNEDLIQKVLIGFKVSRNEGLETTVINYEEITQDAENQSFMNRIYVSPFELTTITVKAGERLFVRCTSETGSVILSKTIMEGCV